MLITSKRKDISNVKRKVVELVTLTFGRFSIDFRRLLKTKERVLLIT